MMTQQLIEVEQIVIYTCRLGYIFCAHCRRAGRGTAPVTRTTESVEYPASAQHLRCDGCNRPMLLSIKIVTATATIEGFPCKVF